MKNLHYFLTLSILLISCNTEVKKKAAPIKDIPLNERAIPPLPGKATNSVIGGAHYICPKSCVGGNGPAAGKCTICSTEMAHNQGFHVGKNNANAAPPSLPNSATSIGDVPNANGQYHYTCSKGCSGGKGKAGPCANCGETLAHNAAFHS
jgi:hypothetical protein